MGTISAAAKMIAEGWSVVMISPLLQRKEISSVPMPKKQRIYLGNSEVF